MLSGGSTLVREKIVSGKENALVLTTPTRNGLLRDGLLPRQLSTRDQILGRGAYGIVYKAIYRERSVAVKIISNHTQCLHNESHALNLKHKNIVGVLKVESTPKFGLVIMECPRGESLQRVLDTLKLPFPHRVFATLDVLAALRYCHIKNLLHLDVKPANILVALDTKPADHIRMQSFKRSYVCKLCDFGSSVRVTESCADQSSIKGTLRYMSPESLRSAPLSSASDIYSLAITMWQMQTGCLPFETLTCNEFIAYHVVKHELRPDSKFEDLNNELSNATPLNYYYVDKDVSLNNTNLLDVANAVSDNCRNIGATRVRRNLNFDVKQIRVLKARHGAHRRDQRLAQYFVDPMLDTDAYLEVAYRELYRCCWIGKPELRLNALQLQKRLELILAKYFQI